MFNWLFKPSRERFAQIVLKAVKRAGIVDAEYEKEHYQIRSSSGIFFLGNAYNEYCHRRGAERGVVLQNVVSTILAADDKPMSADEARESLVAVVRERAVHAFTVLGAQLQDLSFDEPQASVPLSEWFVEGLVVDLPTCMRHVKVADLEEWGLPLDEALAIGRENLTRLPDPTFAQIDPGVFACTLEDDDYVSSRILLADLPKRLPIRGDAIVSIPSRTKLLVTGSEDIDGIKALIHRAEEALRADPRPANAMPIHRVGVEWRSLTLPEGSPVFHDLERIRLMTEANYYAEQHDLLTKLYEKKRLDYLVADYQVIQEKSGKIWSYAVWTRGVPTVLPRADRIMLMDGKVLDDPDSFQLRSICPWNDLLSIAGDQMLDTEHFPKRYFVSAFPTDEQFDRMPRHLTDEFNA